MKINCRFKKEPLTAKEPKRKKFRKTLTYTENFHIVEPGTKKRYTSDNATNPTKMSTPSMQRKVPLKVLHLSMPRTGSLSMKEAYETLGLHAYHGFDFMEYPDHQVEWGKAIDAKLFGKGKLYTKEDFDRFLGEYEVLSDFPFIFFSKEFIEMYPDAKVVLVERDLDKWYQSYSTEIITAIFSWKTWFLVKFLEPLKSARPATLIQKMEFNMFDCHDQEGFNANAKKTYLEHYAKVRRLVPPERRLEYRLGSGWESLCEFLGKPVPDMKFPHKNERKEFAIFVQKLLNREIKRSVVLISSQLQVVLPIAGVAAAWAAWRFFSP